MQGIIGNRLLQRFNITFDYSRNLVYLEPSLLIGDDYEVNKSGFNIFFTDGLPFISNVIDRSPADLAGLRNGDQIVSINGVLVEDIDPRKIRDSFKQESEKIELVILRNNKYKYTEFRLKPLI
jgi:C-terminal processing protease CtpA/Prc